MYTISVVYAVDRRQVATLLDQAQQPGLLLFSLPATALRCSWLKASRRAGRCTCRLSGRTAVHLPRRGDWRGRRHNRRSANRQSAGHGGQLATDRETPVELVVPFRTATASSLTRKATASSASCPVTPTGDVVVCLAGQAATGCSPGLCRERRAAGTGAV